MDFEFGYFKFEWDEDKAAANLKKHGVAFEEAATIFNDNWMMTIADADHSDGEDRLISMGMSERRRLIKVSYTERVLNIRIISARELTAGERRDYENHDL